MSETATRAVVTTGRKAAPADSKEARRIAEREAWPFVVRNGYTIQAFFDGTASPLGTADALLVVGGGSLTLYTHGVEFRYHPGMGVNRLRVMRQGRGDWMIEAMGLEAGDSILDATLGIGSDLLVASWVVGDQGRAVGLESEPLLALVVRQGMANYAHQVEAVTSSLRRIEVVNEPYQSYLARARAGSFDVVYFDPMFAHPVEESRHMIPLRRLGNSESLTRQSVMEAARVARRRVVVKDNRDGPYVKSDWFHRVLGGPRSRIAYCVLDV